MAYFHIEKKSSENEKQEKNTVNNDGFKKEIKSGIKLYGYNPSGWKSQVKDGCDVKREKIENNQNLTDEEKEELNDYVDRDEKEFNNGCLLQ